MAIAVGEFLSGVGTTLRGILGDALANPPSTSNVDESVALAFVDVWAVFGAIDTGIGYVLQQMYGAKKYEQAIAIDVGQTIAATERWLETSIDQVAFTLLPNSLGKLENDIYTGWIVPLRSVVDNLLTRVGILEGFRRSTDSWRYHTVDPHLRTLDHFLHDFYKGDQPAINVLVDWIRHPGHFAHWATPPLVGPIVAYLADPQHETTRDDLARIMVQAWSEKPIDVWDAIEQWLVTDTGS